jgi:dsDNA-specific endonuclease/ATPase MutS2
VRLHEIEREEGTMGSNRQQTMAKIARERSVKERRERKQEKKRQRKLDALERDMPADDSTEPDGVPSEDVASESPAASESPGDLEARTD